MKRYSPEHVNDTAKRFAESPYADMWSLFRADIRRHAVETKLAEGVKKHSRAMMRSFKIEEE